MGRSPTHIPFAFRRKAKGEVFRDALKFVLDLRELLFVIHAESRKIQSIRSARNCRILIRASSNLTAVASSK